MTVPVSVEELLDGHVALEIDCLDRVHLNAYVPNLGVSGQAASFLTKRLDAPVPSPALFTGIGGRYRRDVKRFSEKHGVPLLRFGERGGRHGQRKIDVVRPLLAQAERAQSPAVAAIGAAPELQSVFTATGRPSHASSAPQLSFRTEDRRVSCYCRCVWDDGFGPGFVKLCSWFPYPGKVWAGGHHWAQRQAAKAGIGFAPLSNGFAACDGPAGGQQICGRLGPARIQGFADRWLAAIPTPLQRPGQGRRLLVGAVHAPGRGLSHPGVRRSPPRPGVLRGDGARQPRRRPPAPNRRRWKTKIVARGVQARSQRVLQALPRQGSIRRTAARCASRPS